MVIFIERTRTCSVSEAYSQFRLANASTIPATNSPVAE